MKKIGILGGISYTSTMNYYSILHELHYQRQSDYYYPEIVIESLNFQYFTDLEDQGRKAEYEQYIEKGLKHLKSAGAEFAIMAANSPHSVLKDILPRVELPVLSIVDAVGKHAQALGLKKLLLTGIRYTMNSSFYQEGMKKYGIDVLVPTEQDQDQINHIIFSELVINKVVPSSKAQFLNLISRYPVNGLILGCTELPQLISQKDTETVLLNSLQLHCAEAIRFARN